MKLQTPSTRAYAPLNALVTDSYVSRNSGVTDYWLFLGMDVAADEGKFEIFVRRGVQNIRTLVEGEIWIRIF